MALNLMQYRNGLVRGRALEIHWWNGTYFAHPGVYYLQSDAESEALPLLCRSPVASMGYYFAYDCNASGILGHEHAEYFGRVRDLFPEAESYGTNVLHFQLGAVPPPGMRHRRMDEIEPVYRGLFCHSKIISSTDGIHCSVNFLWQDPCMTGDTYNWYILRDCSNPEDWRRAREVYLNGQASVDVHLD